MANIQGGYGHSDVFAPGVFDFYSTSGSLVTGATINMLTSNLVVYASATLAALTVNLPLNPPDGAVAELNFTATITALTIAANTGDGFVGTNPTTASANTPIRFKYSLLGDITKGVQARSWIRVQ